ncbi:MAG: sortase [Acidimicrobiia bacterium]
MRYKVQVLGWTLIWSGLFTFGYIGYQLYGTDLINAGIQAEASEDLEVVLEASEPETDTVQLDEFFDTEPPPPELPKRVDYHPEKPVEVGESFAFLSIPKIGIDDLVVYEGVDTQTLKSGPGHMPSTPLPGQPGNSVLSGHRTTYGRPFFDFDLLEAGDRVEVESETGTHVYEVREIQVVLPTDVWVTDTRAGGWVTMTTCNPKFSARERLIVFAEMVSGPNLEFVNLHKAKFAEA